MYIRRSSEVLQQLVFGPAFQNFLLLSLKWLNVILYSRLLKTCCYQTSGILWADGPVWSCVSSLLVRPISGLHVCVCESHYVYWLVLTALPGVYLSADTFWWRDSITTVQDAVRKNIRGVKLRSNLKAGFKDGSDPSKGAGSRRVGRRKEPLIADHWSLIWSMRSQLVKYWLL